MKPFPIYLILTSLAVVGNACCADVATVSFSVGKQGTYSETVKAGPNIQVDLAAIPKNSHVFRAVLRPGRDEREAGTKRNQVVRITPADSEDAFPLLPPRFNVFDVTDAVRKAVRSGQARITFRVVSFPGYQPSQTRLDVTATVKMKNPVKAVKDLRVWHRDGQTFLTWDEVDSPATARDVTIKEWKNLQTKLAAEAPQVRYRIYRSGQPITAENFAKAELVDEVGPLTCWNPEIHGSNARDTDVVPRYVVEEGKESVVPGTGIYVHNPAKAGRGYYAITLAVNGEENLTAFGPGNTTGDPVTETTGPGSPVLQRVVKPKEFNYVNGPTLQYYVRWEAPPRCNVPSRPYDYLVGLPANRKGPSPAGLHLHCWGGNLDGGYGWWYNAGQGAILISTNQIPYDWWTGYHEHMGTWKSWSEGVVRDYSQRRVLAFLDWASGQWSIDPNRVFTAGSSMGGSGSPNLGIRHGDRIAWTASWVGVHIPARSPQFRGSYEGVYGDLKWKLPFQDRKTPAFTYFDDEWFVRQHPDRETPLICFSNGKNDGAIGWPQARDFWKALQETHRPHVFVWGQGGHGQRALLPGPQPGERELGVEARLDRSLPAFTVVASTPTRATANPRTAMRRARATCTSTGRTRMPWTAPASGQWSSGSTPGRRKTPAR